VLFADLNRSQADGQQNVMDPRKPDTIIDAEKVKEYMLGTWDFEIDDPSTKTVYEWEMEILSDGRFSENVSLNAFAGRGYF
jgi:hypothetical protein